MLAKSVHISINSLRSWNWNEIETLDACCVIASLFDCTRFMMDFSISLFRFDETKWRPMKLPFCLFQIEFVDINWFSGEQAKQEEKSSSLRVEKHGKIFNKNYSNLNNWIYSGNRASHAATEQETFFLTQKKWIRCECDFVNREKRSLLVDCIAHIRAHAERDQLKMHTNFWYFRYRQSDKRKRNETNTNWPIWARVVRSWFSVLFSRTTQKRIRNATFSVLSSHSIAPHAVAIANDARD